MVPSSVKEVSYQYSMFNARGERVEKSPAFRGPFKSQRCVVPITGFYEWVNRNGQKQPYMVHSPENNGLLLAGLWDCWRGSENEELLESFTILTTNSVPSLGFLHRRQPVMLNQTGARAWLSKRTDIQRLRDYLKPNLPYEMLASPVSTYVNNMCNHGSECSEIVGGSIELPAGSA